MLFSLHELAAAVLAVRSTAASMELFVPEELKFRVTLYRPKTPEREPAILRRVGAAEVRLAKAATALFTVSVPPLTVNREGLAEPNNALLDDMTLANAV